MSKLGGAGVSPKEVSFLHGAPDGQTSLIKTSRESVSGGHFQTFLAMLGVSEGCMETDP